MMDLIQFLSMYQLASGVAPAIDNAARINDGEAIAIEADVRSNFDFYVVKVYNSSGNFLQDSVVGLKLK